VRSDIDTHLGALAVLIRRAAGVEGAEPCDRRRTRRSAGEAAPPIVPRATTRC